jgi:hypothetical protein
VPVLVKRSSGVSTRLPAMVVWLSAARLSALVSLMVSGRGRPRSGPRRCSGPERVADLTEQARVRFHAAA